MWLVGTPSPTRRAQRRRGVSQHGGGLRRCFGQLGAGDELDLLAHQYGGDRSLNAAVGGKLYVFGGGDDEGYLSTAEVYDPASDSWAQVSNLTSARSGLVAAAL